MKRSRTSTTMKKRSRKTSSKRLRVTPFTRDHAYLTQHPQGVEQHFRRMAQPAICNYSTVLGSMQIYSVDTATQAPWISAISSPQTDIGTSSSTAAYAISCQFQLTDLPSYQEFVNLFNEYRIDKIVFEITPLQDMGGDSAIGGQTADLYWVYDPNDAGLALSRTTLCQYDNCRHDSLGNSNKKISYAFVPRAAQSLYVAPSLTGSVSYGYNSSPKALWIDTASPSNGTPHYGLKMWLGNFVNINGSGQCWRMQPIYYFTCRRTR